MATIARNHRSPWYAPPAEVPELELVSETMDSAGERERPVDDLERDFVRRDEEGRILDDATRAVPPVAPRTVDRVRTWLAANGVPVAVAAGVLAAGVIGAVTFVALRSRRRPRGPAERAQAIARATLAAAADRITAARRSIRRR